MPDGFLVRPLPDSPIDIVGDVHGELDALQRLLSHLGYNERGEHPARRRLVFLGDLVDRGPDSPGVFRYVRDLVDNDRADCVLGNHELNLMQGKCRPGNAWFYGEDEMIAPISEFVPSRKADEQLRQECLAFFRRLPIVLESHEIGVVHACWEASAVNHLRGQTEALTVYEQFDALIEADLRHRGVRDHLDCSLTHQNANPIKVLTSGPEERTPRFFANGKWREEGRRRWWNDHRSAPFCVFGHYWRRSLNGDSDMGHLFGDIDDHRALGDGQAMCIDYSVGKRWLERMISPTGPFQTSLAALRWPERMLIFDDGVHQKIIP